MCMEMLDKVVGDCDSKLYIATIPKFLTFGKKIFEYKVFIDQANNLKNWSLKNFQLYVYYLYNYWIKEQIFVSIICILLKIISCA